MICNCTVKAEVSSGHHAKCPNTDTIFTNGVRIGTFWCPEGTSVFTVCNSKSKEQFVMHYTDKVTCPTLTTNQILTSLQTGLKH